MLVSLRDLVNAPDGAPMPTESDLPVSEQSFAETYQEIKKAIQLGDRSIEPSSVEVLNNITTNKLTIKTTVAVGETFRDLPVKDPTAGDTVISVLGTGNFGAANIIVADKVLVNTVDLSNHTHAGTATNGTKLSMSSIAGATFGSPADIPWSQHTHAGDGSQQLPSGGIQDGAIVPTLIDSSSFGTTSSTLYSGKSASDDFTVLNRLFGGGASFSMSELNSNTPLLRGQFISPFQMMSLVHPSVGSGTSDSFASGLWSGPSNANAHAKVGDVPDTPSGAKFAVAQLYPQPFSTGTTSPFLTYCGYGLDIATKYLGVRFQSLIPGKAKDVSITILWGTDTDIPFSGFGDVNGLSFAFQWAALPVSNEDITQNFDFAWSSLITPSISKASAYGIGTLEPMNDVSTAAEGSTDSPFVPDPNHIGYAVKAGCVYAKTIPNIKIFNQSPSVDAYDFLPWVLGCRLRLASNGFQGSTIKSQVSAKIYIMGAWINFNYNEKSV